VHVDVTGDACTGGAANVHAEINSIRCVDLAEHAFHFLTQRHHFCRRIFGQLLQFIQMREGHDHHVAGGVRKAVENDEAVPAAMDYFGFEVRKSGKLAEDAGVGAVSFRSSGDVGVSPGSPEVIHGEQSSRMGVAYFRR